MSRRKILKTTGLSLASLVGASNTASANPGRGRGHGQGHGHDHGDHPSNGPHPQPPKHSAAYDHAASQSAVIAQTADHEIATVSIDAGRVDAMGGSGNQRFLFKQNSDGTVDMLRPKSMKPGHLPRRVDK